MPLIPVRGAAFGVQIFSTTRQVTAMGPFSSGCILDEIAFSLFAQSQTGVTAVQLGFGISRSDAETQENFIASSDLVRVDTSAIGGLRYWRLQLIAGTVFRGVIPVGVVVSGGPVWLLVHHDLEDGTDPHMLLVGVSAKRLVADVVADKLVEGSRSAR